MVARDSLWTLVVDNTSVTGKLVTTAVVVAVALLLGAVIGRLFARRTDDRYRKYYSRKVTHYVVAVVAAIALGIVWRPFAGQLGLVVGLSAAGLAVGMQNLIGALAGWLNMCPVRSIASATGYNSATYAATSSTSHRCAPRSWRSDRPSTRRRGFVDGNTRVGSSPSRTRWRSPTPSTT